MKKQIFKWVFILLCVAPYLGLIITDTEDKNEEVVKKIRENVYAGVSKNLIEISGDFVEEQFEPYIMYSNCCLNIREDNNTNSNIIDTIMPNVSVEVIGEYGEWCEILLDTTTHGFVKMEFLSKEMTPVSKLNRWGIELSEEEINLLSLIVYKEAGIEDMTGKEAVVESIFNRMISETFGGDLYSVLSQKGQYTTWKSRHSATPGIEEYQAIYNVLYGKTNILDFEYVYFSRKQRNGYDFIKIGRHWFSKGKID